jgi:hypothetical protein
MADTKRKFEAQTIADLQPRLQPKAKSIARSAEEAGLRANTGGHDPRSAPPREVVLRLIAWFKRD